MKLFRTGYRFDTKATKLWTSPNVAGCDLIVLAAPGFSRERIAGALAKMSEAIERMEDPNRVRGGAPMASYTAGGAEEVAPTTKAPKGAPVLG